MIVKMAPNKAGSTNDQIPVTEISASTKFCHISAAVEVYVRLFGNRVIETPHSSRYQGLRRLSTGCKHPLTAADVADRSFKRSRTTDAVARATQRNVVAPRFSETNETRGLI